MEVKGDIKVNLSWKVAFLIRCHDFIFGMIGVAVSFYFMIAEQDDFFLHYVWIPLIILSVIEVIFSIYHMFALTTKTTTHLFISIFPVQMLTFFLRFIWFSYLIGFLFLNISSRGSRDPSVIFLSFIVVCIVLDSFSVILLLSAILVRAETLTKFLCKYWIIRDTFVLFISICIVGYYSYSISLGTSSNTDIFFFVLSIVQLIFIGIYFKIKYFEKKSLKPKPLKAELPERQTIKEAYLLMAQSSQSRQEGAGAA